MIDHCISEELNKDGYRIVIIESGKFKGIRFVFREAWVDDDKLSFTYDMIEGKISAEEEYEFAEEIGQILYSQLIEIANGTTDEN